MANNQYKNKIVYNGQTLIDLTGVTVTPEVLSQGYTAIDASGAPITGTMSGGAVIIKDTTDSHGGTIREITATDVVNLQGGKTVTPSTSSQTVTPDTGYDAFESVTVSAMPSGTAGTPIATKGAVSNHAVSVTPSVTNTTGYITGGTKTGTAVSVSASELVSGTYSVTSSGTKDVTNYASASVPTGTEGTPTASKGTVSSHSISVTPSVTNTAGYITGSTKTGTAVTVSASELVSGTLSVTSSGTKDVTNYASASIPSGTEGTPTATKGTVSNHSVTVTPSVTNGSGFISGGTKTGTAVTVSASELVNGSQNITTNNTYDVTNLASVTVNVSGSSWTKVAETSYQVTWSSTSTGLVGFINAGSSAWTSDKIVYVRVRDTEGARAGYFYGSDTYFINYNPINQSTSTFSSPMRCAIRYTANSEYSVNTGTIGYGVYAYAVYSDGDIRIEKCWNSTVSLTIDSTYSVQVYLLDPPTGAPIFT